MAVFWPARLCSPRKLFFSVIIMGISILLVAILYPYITPASSSLNAARHRMFASDGEDQSEADLPTILNRKHDPFSNVLIHARFRTGSTFASDFFLKNQLFHYLFEPFYLIPYLDIQPKMLDLLEKLYNCDFRELMSLAVVNPEVIGRAGNFEKWMNQVFCRRNMSDESCAHARLETWQGQCLEVKHRAIKSVRVPDLQFVRPLMEQGHLKVVHLIRDPRGIMNSRQSIGNNTRAGQPSVPERAQLTRTQRTAQRYCNALQKDLDYAHNRLTSRGNDSRLFKVNYYRVRYEDLASQPKRQLLDMYDHFNLPLDENVIKWATDIEDRNKGVKSGTNVKEMKFRTERNNSTETASAWRKQLPYKLVKVVQNVCGAVMKELGYAPVTNERELLDTNIPVVLPL